MDPSVYWLRPLTSRVWIVGLSLRVATSPASLFRPVLSFAQMRKPETEEGGHGKAGLPHDRHLQSHLRSRSVYLPVLFLTIL